MMERVEFENTSAVDSRPIFFLALVHLAVVVLIITAVLFGAAFSSWIVMLPVLGASLASAVILALLYARYRSQPAVKDKQQLAREARRLQREINEKRELIRKATALRESVPAQEEVAILNRKQEHERLLAQLSSERTSLVEAHQRELKSELDKLRQRRVNEGLARTPIQDASVRGLSSKLKKRLVQLGITTAADVEWGRIKGVRGFDDKKIQRLMDWKNSVVRELNARAPNELPVSVDQQIEATHAAALASIDEREKAAQHALAADLDAIRGEYRSKAKEANARAAEIETGARGELVDLGELEVSVSRELESYSTITFRHYIKIALVSAKPRSSPWGSVVLAGIPIVISAGICFETFVGLGAAAATIANAVPTITPSPTITPTPTVTSSPVPSSTPSPAPSSTPTATPTPAPPTLTPTASLTPTITLTPSATRTLDPSAQLRSAVSQALGESNRGIARVTEAGYDYLGEPGTVYIRWAINENLFESWIKDGAKQDARDILETVDALNLPYSLVWIEGSYPLVDAYGNTEEEMVVSMTYYKSTVDRISWSSFDHSNVYLIADDGWVHPTFRD